MRARGADAVEARHVDVHDHDVGAGLGHDSQRLVAIGGLADELGVVE